LTVANTALSVQINGRTAVTVPQGDRVRLCVDGSHPTDDLEVDFEGSGAWERVESATFVHTYPRPGRFAVAVRSGGHTAVAHLKVTRVTGTGGGGLF